MSGYTRAVSVQRLGKHVAAATDTNVRIEELKELYEDSRSEFVAVKSYCP
jgi:hypothetical protein